MNETNEITWLDHTMEIAGVKWIKGYGPLPCDVMFVGERPGDDEQRYNAVFTGPSGKLLFTVLRNVGLDDSQIYFTNAVKYMPRGKKAINAGDIKKCRAVLDEEIKRANPKLIVCLGAVAMKAVLGKEYLLSDYRGAITDHPRLPGVRVFCTYNPAYVLRNPAAEDPFRRDFEALARVLNGGAIATDTVNYEVIQTVEQLRQFKEFLFATYPKPMISLDCEWHGATWMSKNKYVRTVQLGFQIGAAVILEFTGPNGVQVMDNPAAAWKVLKEILEDPRVALVGQNIISDGEWLLQYDINIRPRVVFDTMLAEYLINELGPFGLEELTLKYTNFGRYDLELLRWKKEHKDECADGFGPIPRELLLPYGARDVDTVLRIIPKQLKALEAFMQPRGEYPSLWDTTMGIQEALYEIEMTGMLADPDRLNLLVRAYNDKLTSLETQIKTAAAQFGIEDFNYNSVNQVKDMLFVRLNLTPIKDTKGKKWDEFAPYETAGVSNRQPSTDHNTLEILQDKHPFVKMLLNLRKVGTVVKYFLREEDEPEENEEAEENQNKSGGGIASKIWPDGRLHPHFSQLSDTGRFRTSKPNCQNWPKKAEGSMIEIFGGKDKVPPLIRTIVVPTPGYVMMEADFVQAELFVLAALSHDKTMWDALTTPGKDLHDLTAINAFSLQVVHDETGLPVDPDYLTQLARSNEDEFKAYQKHLIYVDQRGKRMTRSEFKDTIRVSAKNLNFGIPYGRGALDIARQVKGETGSATPLDQLQAEIDQMMTTWKEVSYVDAWKYMCMCSKAVTNPGHLVNPWGRMRRFPRVIKDESLLNGMQREAQNFPIQSTVADTCMIAMLRMRRYRELHGLHFRIINQIHDAVMVETPENEIEATKQMFSDTMANIQIPVLGSEPLILGIDISILDRWGQKRKKSED